MKVLEVFEDNEFCNNRDSKCINLFRGQGDHFFVNLKHDFPKPGFYDKYKKCSQCKEVIKKCNK